jgi:signal transduction histidine kinase
MEYSINRWDARLDRVLIWLFWITLVVGVFGVFVRDGAIPASYGATAITSLYVLFFTVLPAHIGRRRLVREGVVLAGSILTMTAIAITGDVNSPFLLLGLLPILHSGIRGGFRAGIGAAALSSGILASVVIPAAEPKWLELTRWCALLFLVAITFGYAHRLLTEEGVRSDALAAATAETSARLERLESAHRLLTRLAARADTAELNPIDVATDALDSVRGVVPFKAASINLASESGPITVVRIGDPDDGLFQSAFPMEAGGRQVGALIVGTERDLTRPQHESIEAVLQPATLAFANVLLLQQIARTAIREERTRLARELHDDIGPSLASLGLALDLAALQYPTEPALGAQLHELRSAVGQVVEDVRSTVTDLRTEVETPSLREAVSEIMRARSGSKPTILFQIDERRPARPSIAADINAIVVEALRNAISHADASTITLTGVINYDQGAIRIRDNGRGFDLNDITTQGFGLIGMRERADSIGARLRVDSNARESTVSLTWGN